MNRAIWIIHRLSALCLAITLAACVNSSHEFILAEGDLLFQDLDRSPLCEAIEKVTFGVDGAKFCHVGIATIDDHGAPHVIEAYGTVADTPLSEFLARAKDDEGRPKVIVGRFKELYQSLVPAAIQRARKLLGAPYDQFFLLDNNRFYCSELVWECFRDSAGKTLFDLAPMTFKEPGSSEPMTVWKDYYAELGVPIPEGVAGNNPGSLSRSDKISIVHVYGRPRGWTEAIWLRYAGHP